MGRKKKKDEEDHEDDRRRDDKKRRPADSDDSSFEEEVVHYDIDPEVQELACTFSIDYGLTQKLNDMLIGKRSKTWEQDLTRLYELLKEARSPAAVLTLKLKDMEKGTFVGKAKCGPAVKELSEKHRLDKGASTKLMEAMSMREAMGRDIAQDLALLDEHLQASNKPSALVSQKLESLRKGYNIGHSIYSRELVTGNTGPGVDGVFDKKGKRPLGYSDADLDKRFQMEAGAGAGQLMDEATVRKMMAMERKEHEKQREEEEEVVKVKATKQRKRGRSTSSRATRKSPSPCRKRDRSRSGSARRKGSGSRSRDRGDKSGGRRKSGGEKRSRSRSRQKKKEDRRSPSPGRSRDKRKRKGSSSSASCDRGDKSKQRSGKRK